METIKYTVLIYEKDPVDVQKLSCACRQLGMVVYTANNKDSADKLIRETFFELVIVELSLDKVSFSDDTKIITTGSVSETVLFDNECYRSKSFIPKPLVRSVIRLNLINVSGLLVTSNTYHSNFVKILAALNESRFQLESILKKDFLYQNFGILIKKYCVDDCVFGLSSSKIQADREEYKPIAFESSRGPVFCKFTEKCMLDRLNMHFEENHPELAEFLPGDLLNSIDLAEKQYVLVEIFRKLLNEYNETIQKYVNAKENYCSENCTSIDEETAEHQKRKKILCCEFGCVLDNYFDLTPEVNNDEKRKALVYMEQGKEYKVLEHYCKQLNIEVLYAGESSTAQDIVDNRDVNIAIVHHDLDRIVIPSSVNVVVVGPPTIASTASILMYLPVSFIPTPFKIAKLSLGLLRSIGIFFRAQTFFAFLANIVIAIETIYMRLNNFVIDDYFKMSFSESCSYFCENSCKFATLKKDIQDEDLPAYEVVKINSKRGPLYCKTKKTCPLWKYHGWLSENFPKWNKVSPSEYIQNIRCSGDAFSIRKKLNELIVDTEKVLDKLEQTRLKYCTEVCPEIHDDLNFSKKDNLFSDFPKILQSNRYQYCTYHKCPQSAFFECEKRRIV